MDESVLAVILAAGEGKRMKSYLPKVLQPVGGQAMLVRILNTVYSMKHIEPVVVFGHQGERLQQTLRPMYPKLNWAQQQEQLGTGHAVAQAQPYFERAKTILILLGDVPLIRQETLEKLCQRARDTGFALLSTELDNPSGYGRIVRDEQGNVQRIVEEKDANEQERTIREVNSGIMAFSSEVLQTFLPKLNNQNAQNEYYLTDLVALCVQAGQSVAAEKAVDSSEVMGVNDKTQLASAEAVLRHRNSQALLDAGAVLIDPSRVDIHGTVSVGHDVLIEANVIFKGTVKLGDGVIVESNCVLQDCDIGAGSHIYSHSRIESSHIGTNAQIGPFARLRPNTRLNNNVKIGNFVEIKAAHIDAGSKVNHLSYIGDAEIGCNVNIGAGTITCNYDGVNKHKTTIKNGAFIGSNTALIAPITVGENATIGAGSALSRQVSAGSLTLNRAKVSEKTDWYEKKHNK